MEYLDEPPLPTVIVRLSEDDVREDATIQRLLASPKWVMIERPGAVLWKRLVTSNPMCWNELQGELSADIYLN